MAWRPVHVSSLRAAHTCADFSGLHVDLAACAAARFGVCFSLAEVFAGGSDGAPTKRGFGFSGVRAHARSMGPVPLGDFARADKGFAAAAIKKQGGEGDALHGDSFMVTAGLAVARYHRPR